MRKYIRVAGSPSPSLLRKSTSPKGRGLGKKVTFAWTAKGSHFGGAGIEQSEMTERASPLKEKASAMDFPVLCKPENIAEAFLSPFHGMGGEYLFVLPPHGLTGGKGLFHIQQTLVATAPEPQGDIVLGFNKFAVHQHI